MQNAIENLKKNATTLNNRFFSGNSSACMANEIESELRQIISYSAIPGPLIDNMEETLSMLENSLSSPHLNIIEKARIRPLIEKAKKKIEIRLQNPKNLNISNYTTEKLQSLKYHGYTGDIIITSAGRSVNDQARIMYENIIKHGKEHQLKTYKLPGQTVINTYNPKLSKEENIANMAKKIQELGPDSVSKHVADFSELNVIDIDKRSLSSAQNFKDAAKSAGFTKVLDENGCIHIELPQP